MDTKDLCKRVLNSDLSDDDKIEIIIRLNGSVGSILQPYPYKGGEIIYKEAPYTEITCKGDIK